MGAGTITIPYVFYANGLVLGAILMLGGGALSLYTGYLIAYCAEKTNSRSFEEIAYHLYGTRGMRFTAICNNCCNVGFLISYITLVSLYFSANLMSRKVQGAGSSCLLEVWYNFAGSASNNLVWKDPLGNSFLLCLSFAFVSSKVSLQVGLHKFHLLWH